MKRTLVCGALVAAAALAPAPAYANHLCVTSGGQPVYCAPHVTIETHEICVTSSGRPIVCVF